jgi:hypothetical protein
VDRPELWVSYYHFNHNPDDGELKLDAEGDGLLYGFGDGPSDAWIIDVNNRRVVWYGHCSVTGPIAPVTLGSGVSSGVSIDEMLREYSYLECCKVGD